MLDRFDLNESMEIVLSGVQLGAWGRDLPGRPRLAELVVQIADRIAPGRLRLSSVEPWSVDDALIAAVIEHDRICPHFHIPLQSGDDRILRKMNRGYTAREFLSILSRIRRADANAAIGTDVILGFPGEDEFAFENTLEIIKKGEPTYLHAFSYSKRPGTKAAAIDEEAPKSKIKERTRLIREWGERLHQRFIARQVGTIREVIIEEQKGASLRGLTDNFITVTLTGEQPSDRPGKIVNAALTEPNDLECALRGTIIG